MTLLYPCLMFRGEAEQAMRFYVGAFKGAEILELMRYGHGREADQHKVSRGLSPYIIKPCFVLIVLSTIPSRLLQVLHL